MYVCLGFFLNICVKCRRHGGELWVLHSPRVSWRSNWSREQQKLNLTKRDPSLVGGGHVTSAPAGQESSSGLHLDVETEPGVPALTGRARVQ